jgi:glyoxylase I family protein
MLLHFEHAGMTVSDMDRTVAFYCDLLGLKLLIRRVSPRGGGEVAFLDAGGGQLEIICPAGDVKIPARRVPDGEAGVRHLTFNYDDIDEIFAKLVAAGVPVVEKPREAHNRDIFAKVAFVLDPDGIVIELAQRP